MPFRSAFVGLTILALSAVSAIDGATAQSNGAVSSEVYLRIDRLEAENRRLTGEVERLSHLVTKLEQDQRNRFEDMEFRLLELEGIDPTGMQGGAIAPAAARAATVGTPETNAPDSAAGGDIALAPGTQTLGEVPADASGAGDVTASTPADFEAETAYQSALSLLQRGDSDGADREFRAFVLDHPDSSRGGEARFWMGEISYARSEYQQAARLYLDSQQNYPEDRKAADALFKLGMSLARMGQAKEACLTLREVPLQYPTASPAVLRGAEIESRRLNCGF